MEPESHTGRPMTNEPVTFKPDRRLWAFIVLLLALNKAYKDAVGEKQTDLHHGSELDTPEQLFHNFVSRLGQICDSRPGGFTVTAFAVAQRPDSKVEYVFGSNTRSPIEGGCVKGYISSILESLRDASESVDQRGEFVSGLLREVLTFNRDRVKCYLNGLTNALKTCLDVCEKEGSPQALIQQPIFGEMLTSVLRAKESDIDDNEFLDRTQALMEVLSVLQEPVTAIFVWKRAGDDRSRNTEPWRELRHHSSRLMAYKRAVETLWYSGQMWPDLFANFEVTFVPSSARTRNPLMTSPQPASAILTRLLPAETRPRYLRLAEELQLSFGLDRVIEEEWTRETLRPVVHAEILVLNWLETNGGTRPERFFNGWRFIGSSKPTCKLCHYYISSHPSGIQFRSPHANLYGNWRMPDTADVHGLCTKEEVTRTRQEITAKVVERLRQDIMRTLDERVTDTSRHDSATVSTFAVNHDRIALGLEISPESPSRACQNAPGDDVSQLGLHGEE
ncbi:hypothetical protein RB601_003646 [Gaeumannomyces tritici]